MLFDGRIISGVTLFVAVARAGSYTRASEHVGLSRSGVAKAIARLEDRMSRRLFDRTSRALKLTDEGRAFLEELTPILHDLNDLVLPTEPSEVRGRLRVTADAAFGSFLLVPALSRLVEAYPKLKIDLLVRDRVDNLLTEGVDVAVRFGEPDAKGLDKSLVLRSRIVTCASRAYVERRGYPQTPQDILDGHRCVRLLDDVTAKPHNWTFVHRNGDHQEISPDCNVTVNDAPSVLTAARSGFGVVRALDFTVEEHLRTGELVEVMPEWNHRMWPAYLYTPSNAHASQGLRAFKDFIHAEFGHSPATDDEALLAG
jgi:DNA-binding transcriptional LysR family regulator